MTLWILGGILLLIWTYYLFLLKHLLIIITGTFESRKEGRSKEKRGDDERETDRTLRGEYMEIV